MKSLIFGSGLCGQAEVLIDAPPASLYDVVSDITRTGEWSPECYRCSWLDGATGPAVGARFRGYNRRGWLRWSMTCQVTEAEPGRVFAFETLVRGKGVQSRWRYEMEPQGDGTLLQESFEVLWYTRIIAGLFFGGSKGRQAQMEEGARRTLQRIKAIVEGH